ncbi:MAG: hypothetical protein ACK5YR_21775 [Pirellula sp.]|jgi:hypothetical protein
MKPLQFVTLVLMMLLATVSGCSRVYFFDGQIVDGDGRPIVGASVNLYPHDWPRMEFGRADDKSEEDGSFKANWGSAVGIEYFNMIVTKDGYREQVLLVKADTKELRVVMERVHPPKLRESTDGTGGESYSNSPNR